MKTATSSLFPVLTEKIKAFRVEDISQERKIVLQPLIDLIQQKVIADETVRLNLICTHNSRRSHLAQIWAQTASYYYGIKNVYCYSGGTEATALFPEVAATLQNTGFQIKKLSEGNNPIYSIKFADNEAPVIGFSKIYDDSFNPKNDFTAIMTCSQADGGCPFIAGAEKRIPITFEDPKEFDNSPQQTEKYQERSLQIASEMFYVFSKIEKNVG